MLKINVFANDSVRLGNRTYRVGDPKLTPIGVASFYPTDDNICDKNFTHPEKILLLLNFRIL